MDDTEATGDFTEASTPRVQEQINRSTQDQERQLEAVLQGARRLKDAAVAVNDEVVSQNQMIDQISVQITDAQSDVQAQTAAAKKVTKKHRQLGVYYVVILLELVALIVILSI
ncbi:hypothetical protein P43SY_007449 [Pythium insidiosum]|uniref:t-SNARE coiled-coil homology domain-containing protein n=1 Tax=Pythium insidiosum TaxID=114742 RepID=A0AAD5M5Z2_PYTIN|nr:hypothetical protein P43SY_007449 [Pythium insidiosum]KAJ0398728.1 hypothetical protein ATCC90586_008655 [Pythium insidiosum]